MRRIWRPHPSTWCVAILVAIPCTAINVMPLWMDIFGERHHALSGYQLASGSLYLSFGWPFENARWYSYAPNSTFFMPVGLVFNSLLGLACTAIASLVWEKEIRFRSAFRAEQNPANRRSFLRIHLVTAIVLMLEAASLLGCNVYRQQYNYETDLWQFDLRPLIEGSIQAYGWPVIGTIVYEFFWSAWVFNALCALEVLGLTCFAMEAWIRRRDELKVNYEDRSKRPG